MRKLIITSFACMFTVCVFGQLKVNSTGYIDANNVSINGCIGTPGYQKGGVLTLTSSSINPIYDYIQSPRYPLSLMYTIPQREASYSFVNYYNDRLNYYVTSQGVVYTYYGVVTTSDSLQKKNIVNLGSTLDKINHLRGITFDYKEDSDGSLPRSSISDSNEDEALLGAPPQISNQIKEEKSRKRIGLVAQEVEAVFPEVVRTSFDGTKGILYNDLVGVLVEGIKQLNDSLLEQNTEIVSLRSEVEELREMLTTLLPDKSPKSKANSGNQPVNKNVDAELYDNTPNPFNQETKISYRLPSDVTSAFICIYDMNGRQLKKYPLSIGSPTGSVVISASEFVAGMYIYSLVINNQMIDSKRMTLVD